MAAGTMVRRVLLQINADDGDTETKLQRIAAKADELSAKHPDLKVRIDSAAASAKLAALKAELKSVDDTGGKAKVSIGGFGRALADLASGGLSGGIGQMSMFGKVMAGLNVATGLGEPLMAGLIVTTMALSSSLVAAGAGLGVFGAVAKSVYSQVSGAVSSWNTAQSTTGKASATALASYKAQLAALTPAQQQVAQSIIGAQGAWQNFVAANTAGVGKVMSQGIGLLPKVFAAMQPFLGPTEKALSGIVSMLGKGLSSSGFKSWISAFSSASGPMLTNLAKAIGNIVVGIGGILKAFLPAAKGVTGGLDTITAKFAHWGTTLTQHSGFQSLMSMFKSQTPAAVNAIKSLVGIVKNLVSGMTGLSTFSNSKMLLEIANPILTLLKALSGNKTLLDISLYALAGFSAMKKLSSGVMSVKAGFTAISGAGTVIKDLAVKMGLLSAATTEEAEAQEGADAAMDANPIGIIILAIVALVAAFVLLWNKCKAFRDFWKDVWHGIVTAAKAAWSTISATFDAIRSGVDGLVKWVQSHWKLLATILATVLLGPIGTLVAFIATHWDQIRSLTSRLVGDVKSFFENLPGDLLKVGANMVSALWNGITSMASWIKNKVAGFAHDVLSSLGSMLGIHFSEPSESTVMRKTGMQMARSLGSGLVAGRPYAASGARQLGLAAAGVGAGGRYGTGGGPLQIQLQLTSDNSAMATALKQMIRSKGGNPAVLGL